MRSRAQSPKLPSPLSNGTVTWGWIGKTVGGVVIITLPTVLYLCVAAYLNLTKDIGAIRADLAALRVQVETLQKTTEQTR